jgi:hypothetical protein
MGPKACLDAAEKRKIFSPAGNRTWPSRSSLCQLSCPGFLMLYAIEKIHTFTGRLRFYSEMTR